MKKIVTLVFIVLGALDFLYGLIFKDQISVIAGGAIAAHGVFILFRNPR